MHEFCRRRSIELLTLFSQENYLWIGSRSERIAILSGGNPGMKKGKFNDFCDSSQ